MRILVIEDEAIFANTIEMMLDEMGHDLIQITDNSESFMRLFVATKPDLVLLDINVRGTMSGIELAKKIQKSTFAVPCIFITAFDNSQTFQQAKQARPTAYITKPFTKQQLHYAIELAAYNFYEDGPATSEVDRDILMRDYFFLKSDNQLFKIQINDIYSVKAQDKYCEIHTSNAKHLIRISLREANKKLPPTDFIRIHRSVIINANYIENIALKDNLIHMSNHQTYPISKRYREALLDRLNFLN